MATEQESRDSIETVLSQFDERKELIDAFCVRTKALVEECLKDAGLRYQSVQSRRKRREKLKEKYLDIRKSYRHLDDITDLAALRVIVYYEDEIDSVAEVLKREFEIDRENSIDKREVEPDRFGYYALNFVCRHHKRRRDDVEYKRFANVTCEIQVTSVLRHAWSEIEHDWYDMKDAYPETVKRRFYRLAALLEIAESEFSELRNKKSTYKQSVAIQVEANVPDLPIDTVSLASFQSQESFVATLDSKIAAIRRLTLSSDPTEQSLSIRASLLKSAGISNIQDLRKELYAHQAELMTYVEQLTKEFPNESSATVPKGVSVHFLALFLNAAWAGSTDAKQTFKKVGIQATDAELDKIIGIAGRVRKQHEGNDRQNTS